MFFTAGLKNFRHRYRTESNAGVTLLTAVMVLAAVTAITFALSTLTLKEIRASRQLAQSEPAILSAEAGAETALFFRIRELTTYNNVCPTLVTQVLPSGSSNFSFCNQLYDNPYIFATDSANNEVVLLFDPLNPANPSAGYGSITVNATSSTAFVPSIQLRIYDLDLAASPDVCSSNPICTTVAIPGSAAVPLNPSKSYAIFLIPTSPGTAGGVIQGFDGSGGSLGIPSKNPKVSSTGAKANLLRKLQVILAR
ncbi:MAG: hypothetical protein HY397_00575 [Candidatus Doudnabacteria bacterium]|nr:hypothetical protein [Candidatus Doudnabacteria bacterium]